MNNRIACKKCGEIVICEFPVNNYAGTARMGWCKCGEKAIVPPFSPIEESPHRVKEPTSLYEEKKF